MTVTITLLGSNIPVRIQGAEFTIVDGELLLGRPLLKAIGFNLKEHLEKVLHVVHDKDVAELQRSSAKLASVSYYGLRYQGADDDPFELPHELSGNFGVDETKEIDKTFEESLSDAKSAGMSGRGAECLQKLLGKHRDVFRIKLGPDSPAKLSPMVPRLKKGAQRSYVADDGAD